MIAQNVLRVFGYIIIAVTLLVFVAVFYGAASSGPGPDALGLLSSVGVLLTGLVLGSLFLAIAVALERLESIDRAASAALVEAQKQTERLEYLAQVQYEALGVLKSRVLAT